MSMPAQPLLYANVTELQQVLQGTDGGIGSPAQLTTEQLTLALYSATNRVSAYVGNVFDGSTPQAVAPPLLHDLTLDLAAMWALATYLKNKEVPATHPIFIKYKDAMQFLTDVRDGKVRFDPAVAGTIGEEVGVVINRIPPIFTGDDSNTQVNPFTGTLEPGTPDWMWTPGNDIFDQWPAWGPVYQG